jgi:hypothetical protein
MATIYGRRDYWAQYKEALKLFGDGDIAGNIAAAKFSLT